MEAAVKPQKWGLTAKILTGMVLGIAVGLIIRYQKPPDAVYDFFVHGIFNTGGIIFINTMKMLIVPIVFVSLIGGISNIGGPKQLGRIGLKTLCLYLLTTSIAISIALVIASIFDIGSGSNLVSNTHSLTLPDNSIKTTLINMVPQNPLQAMVEGNMLQIIIFSILVGFAITLSGDSGKNVKHMFQNLEDVLMQLVIMVIAITPFGVFCLIANLFAEQGISFISHLASYFFTVLSVLIIHILLTNSLFLLFLGRLNPMTFFKKMISPMMFAFSTSSSNVSIPIVLETVEDKLGVKRRIASFIVPLGATINMDGTAIMQGVATVFIAHAYNIDIGISAYLMVILTATLASIGTAGVPGVGLITLAMVLHQAGLPTEGIGLIIGADRLLDMARTVVNVTGDSMIACVIAHSEDAIDKTIFDEPC